MARKIQIVCDLCGEPVTTEHSLGILVDGRRYATDLCDEHAQVILELQRRVTGARGPSRRMVGSGPVKVRDDHQVRATSLEEIEKLKKK